MSFCEPAIEGPRPDQITEKSFREIFEEAPIGMVVLALDERFIRVNARFCHMVGYKAEELMQRTAEELTFPDDVEDGRALAQELLGGKQRYTGEKRYVHKNGTVLWVNRTASLIRDDGGQPQHFLLMIEDISARKRNEQALAASRNALEAALHTNQLIMNNSLDVICTLTADGRFISVNSASEQLWGYRPAEMVGRSFADFVHPDDHDRTLACATDLMAAGRLTDFVNRYRRKDGTTVDVLWSATWSAEHQTIFAVAHDVTERARIEKDLREAKQEAERANHAKSEFLSRMSHELRTPLNAILGFGQLLERQNPTETQRTRVRHILSAGRHLLNLINEVLDISRIEAGNLQLSVEPVSLGETLGEAIDLMRPLAAERGITVNTLSALDSTVFVLADHQRLKQVLLNLLTNAVKYSPAESTVTLSYFESENDSIRVLVTDNGAGIPAQNLGRLFTPFDRLGAEQSNVEGTGLGLALCERLMRAMNGSIGVESEFGAGSTFWLELPAAESPLAHVVQCTTDPSSADAPLPIRRILYIEDNFSNLTLVEQMLAEQSHIELITAMQGSVGLELAKQHALDLILLDLHLPDMPGWQVLAHLKGDERTYAIPVVVISADATKRQIKRLLDAGAHTYLTKPLDIVEFFRVIDEITSDTQTASVAA